MKKVSVNWVLLLTICLFTSAALAEDPYQIAWSRQLGTSDYDWSYSVAVDNTGNSFITGLTKGSLGGTNFGDYDAFLAKYDSDGNLLWTEQLGTSSVDGSWSVAVDGAGNTFISGKTEGNLGGINAGREDAYLAKYDPDGNHLWTNQLGTSTLDFSHSVALDGIGNIFISGYTGGSLGGTNAGASDAFLTKYDPAGNLLWTEQLGTSSKDLSYSVVLDSSGNAFISGYTEGNLGGTNTVYDDAFLAKYDPDGTLLWIEQLGTSDYDESFSVAVDASGNAFISGLTEGSLGGTNVGSRDAFLSKYDPAGNLLWTEQLGTNEHEKSWSVAVDASGNAFISGNTYGSLGGTNAGLDDAFLAKYDTAGNLLWTEQLGTSHYDRSTSVAVDAVGNVFISGNTYGSLGGTNASSSDAFLVKFAVPEPGSLILLGLGGLALLRKRRRQ
jgi:hypothetical protein